MFSLKEMCLVYAFRKKFENVIPLERNKDVGIRNLSKFLILRAHRYLTQLLFEKKIDFLISFCRDEH